MHRDQAGRVPDRCAGCLASSLFFPAASGRAVRRRRALRSRTLRSSLGLAPSLSRADPCCPAGGEAATPGPGAETGGPFETAGIMGGQVGEGLPAPLLGHRLPPSGEGLAQPGGIVRMISGAGDMLLRRPQRQVAGRFCF